MPRTPSSVTVQGQVYSANAFVFERGKRAHDYIRHAGGPDRLADKRRLFVLRADGSVYSAQYGNVERANIFPGDTIVLPPKLTRTNIFRDILTIASVAGSIGYSYAALSYLTR